jgi:hypothetical protein
MNGISYQNKDNLAFYQERIGMPSGTASATPEGESFSAAMSISITRAHSRQHGILFANHRGYRRRTLDNLVGYTEGASVKGNTAIRIITATSCYVEDPR